MRGQNKGFAFITMENERAAKKALNYDGHKFYDRKLKVSVAEKKAEIEEKRMKGEEEKSRETKENAE